MGGFSTKDVAPLALGSGVAATRQIAAKKGVELKPKALTCSQDAVVHDCVIMLIVPEDIHGDIKWGKEIEVKSLEAFALEQNKRMRDTLGHDGQWYWVILKGRKRVERTDTTGKIIEIYYPCATNPYRFI